MRAVASGASVHTNKKSLGTFRFLSLKVLDEDDEEEEDDDDDGDDVTVTVTVTVPVDGDEWGQWMTIGREKTKLMSQLVIRTTGTRSAALCIFILPPDSAFLMQEE
eukprot:s675_g28.t1